MGDNNPKKQPLPENPIPTQNEGDGSSGPSAPYESPPQAEHHSTSPVRPPPPAGFVYPTVSVSNTAPYPTPQPNQDTTPSNGSASYDMPPPSYQAAMSYPAAPTYGGSMDPKFFSGQPPTYYHPPTITQTRLPQPIDSVDPIIRTIRVNNPNTNVVVHVQPGAACRNCNLGVITRQTDMCCLLCLIMLTIFTFPFGLIFLCCVPCTVQNRCTNCSRIA